MQVIWFAKQFEKLRIVTLEVKKVVIKSFTLNPIFSYVNPNSEFKYRIFTIWNAVEGVVVDYTFVWFYEIELEWQKLSVKLK